MADEFLRVGGRSDTGIAKALKTDENGNLGVLLTGSIVASVDIATQIGTIPAGTIKYIDLDPKIVKNAGSVSFSARRSGTGTIESVHIEHRSTGTWVTTAAQEEVKPISSWGSAGVGKRINLLTTRPQLAIKATAGADLQLSSAEVIYWRDPVSDINSIHSKIDTLIANTGKISNDKVVSLYSKTDLSLPAKGSSVIFNAADLKLYNTLRLSLALYSDTEAPDLIMASFDGLKRVIAYDFKRYSEQITTIQGVTYTTDHFYEFEVSSPKDVKVEFFNNKSAPVLIAQIRLAGVK